MYGSQSEIQRIQSKLQQIGQGNPHRMPVEAKGHDQHAVNQPEAQSKPPPKMEDASTFQGSHTVESSRKVVNEPGVSYHPENHNGHLFDAGIGFEPPVMSYAADQDPWYSPGNSHTPTDSDAAMGKNFQGIAPPFRSTRDRYNSPAGQQALREMEKAVDLPDAIPEVMALAPQRSWPQQISVVDENVKAHVHQLAHSLRKGHAERSGRWEHEGFHGIPNPELGAEVWSGEQAEQHYAAPEGWYRQLSSFNPSPRFTISQGGVWLAAAIVVRMGIDRLLLQYPHLWIVMAAMVLTPVAIALYQTAVNPQSTVHSGRRLLVIMMGLLIGGQL